MAKERTKVEKARKASGMTLEAAAAIIGVSVPTYMKKERDPMQMTFEEFFALAAEMDEDGAEIMSAALDELSDTASDDRPLRGVTIGEFFGVRNSATRLGYELAVEQERAFARTA